MDAQRELGSHSGSSYRGFGAKSLGKQTLREGNVKHQMRKKK
jgi:hypothetical protein